jgi:PAS domain S-box-containing protein
MEDALQKLQEEQQVILDSIPAWVFYKDKENRFLRVNNAFTKVMGVSRENLEGKSLLDFYPKEQAEAFLRDDLEVMVSERPKINIIEPMETPKGTVWVQTDKIPYRDAHGKIIGIIGFSLDVTERKKAEKVILELNETLRRNNVELEALNRELEVFAYSVSHDLRAPLRTIDGFSLAILEDYSNKLDDQGKDYLKRLRGSSQKMAQLIDDLLKLSRVTRSEMHSDPVDLSGMVRKRSSELQGEQPDRLVEFVISPKVHVIGDKNLLAVVVDNLLGNAWKYTGKHPSARIEFGTTEINGKTAYFFKDDGAGFDMKYKAKLFAPFQRLHTSEDFPGTGIGLATIQRIVRRHGGEAWAEGETEKGATFFFTLK